MTEQEITNQIEKLCGSPQKAEKLNYLWHSTLGSCHRELKFKKDALKEGFPQQAVKLFLIC